jgi:sigma-B regulation protein RsbU (phosphoserine phosphatase)
MENEKDKVLIVEDEKDTRFILEKLLTKNNYEVRTSVNGVDALEALKEFSPKVILADWTMPVMDGITLCNEIKQNNNFKTIYYIILTARASLKDRVAGLDIGADDFLVKPIENQELLARIRSGVRIYNLQSELKSIEHNRAIIEMACTLGHKINNPLSSLVISIKNLEDELKNTGKEKLNDDFYIINESIARIKSFVNDLINLENPTIINYSDDKNMIDIN